MVEPQPDVSVEWELGYLAGAHSVRSPVDGLPDCTWRNPYREGSREYRDYTAGMMTYCREATIPDGP